MHLNRFVGWHYSEHGDDVLVKTDKNSAVTVISLKSSVMVKTITYTYEVL